MATFNTFALLGMDGDEDDGWQDVTVKKTRGKEQAKVAPPPPSSRSYGTQQSNTAAAPKSSHTPSIRPQTATSSYGNKDTRGVTSGQRAHDYYKAFQTVYKNPKTGETVLQFHKTEVVRIRPDGGVILNSGGFRTMTTLLSMNDALGLIGMRVVAQGGADVSNWTIKDGSGNYMYADNCLVSAKSESDTGRAALVLAHYQGGGSGASTNNGSSSGPGAPRTPPPTLPNVRNFGLPGGSAPAAAPPATLSYQEQYAQLMQQQQAAAAAASSSGAPSGTATAPASSGSSFASMLRPGNAAVSTSQGGYTMPPNQANGVSKLADRMGGLSVAANTAPEEEGLDDDSACIVCMARRATMLLLPCGHSNMCAGCWKAVEQICNDCPTCRQPVTCSIDM